MERKGDTQLAGGASCLVGSSDSKETENTLPRDMRYSAKWKHYCFKRKLCFADEWGFYLYMMALWYLEIPFWLMFCVGLVGTTMIATSYKNLSHAERELGLEGEWFLWPFFASTSAASPTHRFKPLLTPQSAHTNIK